MGNNEKKKMKKISRGGAILMRGLTLWVYTERQCLEIIMYNIRAHPLPILYYLCGIVVKSVCGYICGIRKM